MRIVVIGDDGVGKSSLVTCLFKDRFIPNIEDVLPTLYFPRNDDTTVALVDTSPSLDKQPLLLSELRQANCIWMVFSDHYTMERVSLFWLPFLRNNGVNLPIILCQNKQDWLFHENATGESPPPEANVVEEEEDVIQLMEEFKEIESFIKCSAKEKHNVNEAFYLCQRAIAYPLAPLFDSKNGHLKPLTQRALSRIFFLCDEDQSGFLTQEELQKLQKAAFQSKLSEEEYQLIVETLLSIQHDESDPADREDNEKSHKTLYDPKTGMSLDGFLTLAELYCERGRHETIWIIIRHFHYTDSLSLDDKFLRPPISVGPQSHVELSPNGYQFLVDLFTLFDKDNDGGLRPEEVKNLFTPTPRLPELWSDVNFPFSTLRNENGYVTLQGWLAQWSMFVFLDHENALAYIAMLGYQSRSGRPDIKSAIRVTKPAKKRNPRSTMYLNSTVRDRQVFNCFVFGSRGAGKSSLMSSFLGNRAGNISEHQHTVVNSVEMPGGKQCYLILQEFDDLEDIVLTTPHKLDECDVICLTYDSSDPDSFVHLVKLRNKHRELDDMPLVFAALKADLDRVQQRYEEQPDVYTANLGIAAPMHVSSAWPSSLSALFVQLVDIAMHPGKATVVPHDVETEAPVLVGAAASTAIAVGALAAWWLWLYPRRA